MPTDDNDNFNDKISTANVDVSAPEPLNDLRVVTRGKDTRASIIQKITFTIVSQLRNHGLKHGILYKSPKRRYF